LPNSAHFIAHVLELMHPAGHATARAMFGGHGVYIDGMIVGIVIDDVLFLKTDDATRGSFTARELPPFCYSKRGGEKSTMGYHRAPDEALESPDAMSEWLRPAVGVALRAARSRSKREVTPAAPRPRKKPHAPR
jgi:DNA transformation protein